MPPLRHDNDNPFDLRSFLASTARGMFHDWRGTVISTGSTAAVIGLGTLITSPFLGIENFYIPITGVVLALGGALAVLLASNNFRSFDSRFDHDLD
jgi:hypothetical protein